uniref:Uncharacterized protein n=1 Tax=Pelagomonas calceolata TaxID=35677 RepID=A0A7S4A5A5_9STRA|mmetsp:Transcript_3434/g.9827  ORF Transcript_3434/g.9827 Transcript_3434/m.9827 type:complete len:110 (-) Transcript_3434:419-748(-)
MSDSDSDEGGGLLPPIHRAAIAGDLEALRRELEAGVSPDCLCYSGGSQYTPLIILCSSGTTYGPGFGGSDDIRLQAVKILLEAALLQVTSKDCRRSGLFASRLSLGTWR